MLNYNYSTEIKRVFTDDGLRMFLQVRDRAVSLIGQSGACTMGSIVSGLTGDTFLMMACVDKLIDLEEIREVIDPDAHIGQDRIFMKRVK